MKHSTEYSLGLISHGLLYTGGRVLYGPESPWRSYCMDVWDLTPQTCHMEASSRSEKDLQVKCFLNVDCHIRL